MALPKQVKVGGSYHKGYIMPILSTPGDYTLFITLTGSGGAAANGISLTPSEAGPGDTMKVQHMSNRTGGNQLALLAEDIPNMGGGIPINLDFFSMEKLASDESLKVTYTNTASVAMNVFVIVERGR